MAPTPEVRKAGSALPNPTLSNRTETQANETINKIFSAFDPKGTGTIGVKQMDDVDKLDGNSIGYDIQGCKATVSVFDVKTARGEKATEADKSTTISTVELTQLLGGKTFPDIEITREDALKHLKENSKDRKTLEAFLNGKSIKPGSIDKTLCKEPEAPKTGRRWTTQYDPSPSEDEDQKWGPRTTIIPDPEPCSREPLDDEDSKFGPRH